jgi:hypothetical protein
MPLSNLLRIFIFTNGDGKTVMSCPVASGVLEDTVGTPLNDFLGKVPFDIIAKTNIAQQIKQTGQFPESAWSAMSKIDYQTTNNAQIGLYRTCVRLFENPSTKEEGVCVLLYKKDTIETQQSPQKTTVETQQPSQETFAQYTGTGVCDVCNRSLGTIKAYIVPNNVFYASRLWRNHFKMVSFGATDADIDRMKMNDKSAGSAVCENCIYMFQ